MTEIFLPQTSIRNKARGKQVFVTYIKKTVIFEQNLW